MKQFLTEKVPPGTGWSFTFGAVLLFGLLAVMMSGLALSLYYAPTPDHAWDSVNFIITQVRLGSFLRGMHYWGTRLVIVVLVAHLVRVVLLGSYHRPRHINWVVGVVLLAVVLGSAMTGLLLPWDQGAYWATVVRIGIAQLTPLVGDYAATFLRGGPDIGALTLTRWHALHVIVLPAVLCGLVALHLVLKRQHGLSGPVRAVEGDPHHYFPRQAARDLAVVSFAAVVLGILAWHGAPPLDPPADPTAHDFLPRPEWYFAGLFQFVKMFPGKFEVIGAIVIPGIAMTALALLPWIDRGHSRAWEHRRPVIMLFVAGFFVVAALTTLGALDTVPRAGGRWNPREVAGAALVAGPQCTRCHQSDGVAQPIAGGHISRPPDWLTAHVADPEMIAPGLREMPAGNDRDRQAILAALVRLRAAPPPEFSDNDRQVSILINRHCLSCHVVDGVGGKDGPELTHEGLRQQADAIALRITTPKAVKPDAEMPSFASRLTAAQTRQLAEWLAARK